jgi:DNA helicase-2/ATP-dependent DNA helicase PcrA
MDFHTALERMLENPGLIPGLKTDTIASILEFQELLEKYRKEFLRGDRLTPVLSSLIHELKFENEFLREGDSDSIAKARMLNLSELVNMLSFMESNWEESSPPTLFDFLAQLGLQASDNEEEGPRGRVQLLTMHLSKGLEFPVVFLVGMEEGLFPAGRALEESSDQSKALSEERRLFYVGITRARLQLNLSACSERRKFGEAISVELSRFIQEIPEQYLEWTYRADETHLITTETKKEMAKQDLLEGLDILFK